MKLSICYSEYVRPKPIYVTGYIKPIEGASKKLATGTLSIHFIIGDVKWAIKCKIKEYEVWKLR